MTPLSAAEEKKIYPTSSHLSTSFVLLCPIRRGKGSALLSTKTQHRLQDGDKGNLTEINGKFSLGWLFEKYNTDREDLPGGTNIISIKIQLRWSIRNMVPMRSLPSEPAMPRISNQTKDNSNAFYLFFSFLSPKTSLRATLTFKFYFRYNEPQASF